MQGTGLCRLFSNTNRKYIIILLYILKCNVKWRNKVKYCQRPKEETAAIQSMILDIQNCLLCVFRIRTYYCRCVTRQFILWIYQKLREKYEQSFMVCNYILIIKPHNYWPWVAPIIANQLTYMLGRICLFCQKYQNNLFPCSQAAGQEKAQHKSKELDRCKLWIFPSHLHLTTVGHQLIHQILQSILHGTM